MMKILHISKYYPPYKGGIEDMAYSIVKCLKDNYDQTVLCFNDNKTDVIDYVDSIKIYRIGNFFKLSSQPISFLIYFKIKQLIKELKPDIIHFHAPNPLIGFFLLYLLPKDTKLIIHWHADIEIRFKIYPFYKPFEKGLLKRAQKIIITSPNYINLSFVLRSFESKIVVIPNTINESKLSLSTNDGINIESIKEKYGQNIIFSFGRHVPYKGFEYLIKAEKYIKNDCNILIGGSGPITNKLKELNNSKRIHFIGRISDEELKYYLLASKIFAFPSITRAEAFGIALAEAMYCKLPSVTFTIEGSGVNWVSPANISSIEVENKNYKALANAFDLLLNDKDLRKKLSSNAYDRVTNNFTMYKVEKKIKSLYNDII